MEQNIKHILKKNLYTKHNYNIQIANTIVSN